MARQLKSVALFGSTGSIGRNAIRVLKKHADRFRIDVLTAGSNAELLAKQAMELNPRIVVIADPEKENTLKKLLDKTGIKVRSGADAIIKAASDYPVDITLAGIVGMAGLPPLLESIHHGAHVLIANKEPLVAAGPIVRDAALKSGATLVPVDSEHNAVFQIFDPAQIDSVQSITLTASGGPFRESSLDQMRQAAPEDALAHPTWSMGQKISIDSATMMNKALEVIEAHYLFDLPPEKIKVLIHPQSLMHAFVSYRDGSVLAHMGAADMCTAITNAFGWPERIATPGEGLDLNTLSQLEFSPVDHNRFPAVQLAYKCLEAGQAACIAMNAANEIAVEAFLNHNIAFLDIYLLVHRIVDQVIDGRLQPEGLDDLRHILAFDEAVREETRQMLERRDDFGDTSSHRHVQSA